MGNKSSVRKSIHADVSSAAPRMSTASSTSRVVPNNQQPRTPLTTPSLKLSAANLVSIRPVEQASRTRTPLDQKITIAMKERWHERSQQVQEKENQLTRILLKLPQAAVAFNSVRSMFQANKKEQKGFIDFNDLYRVFQQLDANFSAEEISQVFKESDMMENGKLNFNEFLLCLAIGCVLHRIPILENVQEQRSILGAPIIASSQAILFGEGNTLRCAFQLAIDAFLWFDVDGDGVINRTKVSAKLQQSMALHSPTRKMSAETRCIDTYNASTSQAIWEQRFAEMDWNGDGTIHFKEFLMAFEFWVGLEDEVLS